MHSFGRLTRVMLLQGCPRLRPGQRFNYICTMYVPCTSMSTNLGRRKREATVKRYISELYRLSPSNCLAGTNSPLEFLRGVGARLFTRRTAIRRTDRDLPAPHSDRIAAHVHRSITLFLLHRTGVTRRWEHNFKSLQRYETILHCTSCL